jgi:ATP-dependent exoDNAse (exonuclease V) beta subunit
MSVRASDPSHDAAGEMERGMRRMVRIVANAGSGKTYELSTRYIEIVAELLRRAALGGDAFNPACVLATTFTRAAAGEIRDRILTRLAEAVIGGAADATPAQRQKRRELEEALRLRQPRMGAFDPAPLLLHLTRELDRLEIRTIDSVFTRLAQCFGREAGLPLPLRFLTEAETEASSRRALQRVAETDADVDSIARRLQHVLAGVPASSVERVLLGKVDAGLTAYRDSMAPDHDPRDIPAAWSPPEGAMSGRLLDARELAAVVDDLRRAVNGITQPRKSYDTMLERLQPVPSAVAQWRAWIKTGPQAAVNADPAATTFNRKDIPADCLAAIRKLLDHITAIEDRAIEGAARGWAEFLQRIDHEWKHMMTEQETVTFESVTRALSNAMRRPDMTDIAFRLDARIDHLLLDEFQDTSVGQWQALRPLAQEIAATGDDERFRSLLVVGDPKQSIYGWRAGEPRLLRHFERMILDGEQPVDRLEKDTLSTSWRSAPVILSFVDHLFSALAAGSAGVVAGADPSFRDACRNWTEGYAPHQAAHPDLAGCVQVRALSFVSRQSQKERDRLLIAESAAIAIEQYKRFDGRIRVAIIARRNKDVAKLVDFIRRASPDTPCIARAGGDLQTSPAVVAFLDVLRFCAHPGDTISLYGAATTPLGGALGLHPEWATHHADAAVRQQRAVARGQAAAAIRRTIAQQGVARTLSQWMRRLRAPATGDAGGATMFDAGDRLRLSRLIHEATQLEQDASRTIDDLVRSLCALRVQDAPGNAIEVINIHQAKGLEWDAVIYHAGHDNNRSPRPAFAVHRERTLEPPTCVVPWITAKPVPPRYRATMEHAEDFRLQEQLSQLYVALTRAKHGLWITAAEKSQGSGPTHAGLVCDAIATMGNASTQTRNGFTITTLGDVNWSTPIGGKREGGDQAAIQIECVPVSAPAAQMHKVRALRSPSFEAAAAEVSAAADAEDHASEASSPRAAPRGATATPRTKRADQGGGLLPTERGTIAHLVAQSVRWSDQWQPDAERLTDQAHAIFPLRQRAAVAEVVRGAIEQLQSPEIRALLAKPAGDAAVFHERAFVRADEDGGLQEGTMDRVVLRGRPGAWIAAQVVDFKSDAFDPKRMDLESWKRERAAHHARQLQAYAEVVSREHGVPLAKIDMKIALLAVGAAAPCSMPASSRPSSQGTPHV